MMLKLRVLRMIGKKNIYSYAIVKEFSEGKHAKRFFGSKKAIKNEVYNTINLLEKSGCIKLSNKSKSPRIKNYYKITNKGKLALGSIRKVFISSMKEISYVFK